MVKLLGRKLALAAILLPALNFIAFTYAVYHPRLNRYGESQSLALSDEQPSYLAYLSRLFQGDFGTVGTASVNNILTEAIVNSVVLVAIALAFIIVLGPLLGLLSISRRTRRISPLGLIITTLGASMPGFFFGVAIISLMLYNALLNGARMPLPMSGFGLDEHLILPVFVLASRPVLQVARLTANLIESELQQDYIRVAQSKGLGWLGLSFSHILPNISAAVVTTIGQSARLLVPGIIIVETLFIWPGLGRMLMLTIGIRTDGRGAGQYFAHPELLAALTVIFALWLVLSDILTDLTIYRLDPRMRQGVEAAGSV